MQKLQNEGEQKGKRKQALLEAFLELQNKANLSAKEIALQELEFERLICSYKTAADYLSGEVKISVTELAQGVLSFQVMMLVLAREP